MVSEVVESVCVGDLRGGVVREAREVGCDADVGFWFAAAGHLGGWVVGCAGVGVWEQIR